MRVLIHEDAKPEEVIRLLKKIRQWIKKSPELINDIEGRDRLLNSIKSRSNDSLDDDIPF